MVERTGFGTGSGGTSLMHKVITLGTFDVPHIGHVMFLSKVMSMVNGASDEILVGINTDRFASTFKEPPLYNEDERMVAIRALGFACTLNDGPGIELIRQERPALVVVGSDWLDKGNYLSQIGATTDDMRRFDFNIVFVPYSSVVSTTDIKRRMAR